MMTDRDELIENNICPDCAMEYDQCGCDDDICPICRDNLEECDGYCTCEAEADLERDEYERDLMLEQQEREDFCECDESYGYYGGDDYF